MTRPTIYIRTDKGELAAASSSRELANDLRKVLNAIDGTSAVDALQSKLNFGSAGWLDRALAALVAKELIREADHPEGALDFTAPVPTDDLKRKADEVARREAEAKTRRETEEKARRNAEAKARQEAEAKARQEAEAKVRREAETKARQEAEAKARQEAEAKVRREAEAKARQEAEAKARQEAEAKVRREAEEKIRREAEERARREVEDKVRRDAEAQAKLAEEQELKLAMEERVQRKAAEHARQEAEEQALREAAERVRREAEDKVRREAEDKARREAEEEARREAAERLRQEAEQRAQREAAESARQEAEAQTLKAAEEQTRRDAEQQARRETEEKRQREADEKTRVAAEAQVRREEKRAAAKAKAVAKAQAGPTRSVKWGKPLALGIAALLVLGLAIIHLISFDGRIPQFEKLLSEQFQQPVKIQALRLSLLPHTHLRLEGVSVGGEGQIKIVRIKAIGALGNLSSDKKVFTSIELDSPVITEAGLGWVLFGKSLAGGVVFGEVRVLNARLESKNISLPAFDARLPSDGDEVPGAIVIESVDKNLSLELTPKGESVQIDFKARSFKIPFGSDLTLDDLVASGTADRTELAVTEFRSFAYGGILSGKARLKWGANWSLTGELNAKQIDVSRLFPGVAGDGRLAGTAAYAMQAPDAAKLFAAKRLEGDFLVSRGILLGVDLGRMLQQGAMGGDTGFAEITGSFVHDRGATQLRQVRLAEGPLSASGTAEVDTNGNVLGRFVTEFKIPAERLRASLAASGTLRKIEWRRP